MDNKIKVNDTLVRIIGIQLFGIVIPNATGLVEEQLGNLRWMLLMYGYFILIAFLIWQGNRYLLFRLQQSTDWFQDPIKKIIFLLLANVLYTAPLTIGMLRVWYVIIQSDPSWTVIINTTLVCVVCVIFVTHVYETVFLIKDRQSDMLKNEQLEKAKVQAELQALKNQVDPHFMFNSLNSLSFLIENNAANAKLFAENLAEVYRYILNNKDQTLVLLEDEMIFLKEYTSLLKLRYDDTLSIKNEVDKSALQQYLIPPMSLFIALENVVKHNEISKKYPMTVDVELDRTILCIANPKRPKKSAFESTHIGLKNLNDRFSLSVQKEIIIESTENSFQLGFPLLSLNN